jgi:hypothetical protein
MTQRVSTAVSRLVVDGLLPMIDRRLKSSVRPFDNKPEMLPHNGSPLWSMIHYGLFIPLLPEPYRYLNTMTMIGTSGAEVFDDAAILADDPRTTATVLSSTAKEGQVYYQSFDAERDCDFADDGSVLRWGDALTVTFEERASGDDYARVVGRYDGFTVDIEFAVTDSVSYFVDTPIYQHLSRLASFEGTITDADGVTPVSGLGTFEYARALSLQALSSRPVPAPLKLPVDLFTYQIIQLDERTQLLLTCVSARGAIACLMVHVRVLGEPARVLPDTTFEVLEYGDEQLDPQGRAMRVPARFRWTAREDGREVISLEATVDSPWRHGHGRGYVGAYTYAGTVDANLAGGDTVAGSGYVEWVDVQADERRTWQH